MTTTVWKPDFSQSLSVDSSGWSGFNVRDAIPASAIPTSGSQVRLTLQTSTVGGCSIDALWLGHGALSGNTYDFDGTQVQVTVNGSTSFTIPANTSIVTDPIVYALDETRNFVIAAHFNATSAVRAAPTNSLSGALGAFLSAANQAANTTVTGYSENVGAVYLLNTIAVLVSSGDSVADVFLYSGQVSNSDIRLLDPTLVFGGTSVTLTGVSATSAVGSPTETGFANVTLTGIDATAAVGTATIAAAANVTLAGVAATSAVNTPTVTGFANVTPSGVAASSAVNTETVTGFGNVTPTGVAATSAVNIPAVSGKANVTPTGVSATAAVGTLTASTQLPVSVTLTGVSSVATIGSLSVIAAANTQPTGVNSSGAVGSPAITGLAGVSVVGVSAISSPGVIAIRIVSAINPNRVIAIAGEVRTIALAAELRVVAIGAEDRILSIDAESRQIAA